MNTRGSNIATPLSCEFVSDFVTISQSEFSQLRSATAYWIQKVNPSNTIRTTSLKNLAQANVAFNESYQIIFEAGNIPQHDSEANELEIIFKGLAKNWKEATGSFSLNMRRYTHPTYQVLMRTLENEDSNHVLRLILKELKERPDMWFEALKTISKADPAKDAETFNEAVDAWLNWGKREHHLD